MNRFDVTSIKTKHRSLHNYVCLETRDQSLEPNTRRFSQSFVQSFVQSFGHLLGLQKIDQNLYANCMQSLTTLIIFKTIESPKLVNGVCNDLNRVNLSVILRLELK